jgi:hypothetical protein
VTYKDIVGAPKGCYGVQLAAAYQVHLKARILLIGESLQEFAAAIEQSVHHALVGLPMGFIQIEAAHTFINGMRD